MNLFLRLLMLAVLASSAAQAQEVQIGVGLLCDTRQQAERFVALFDGNTEAALQQVNEEAGNPMACSVVQAAYILGEAVSEARNKQGTFAVTEIMVVGAVTNGQYVRTAPAVQYTLFKAQGVGI